MDAEDSGLPINFNLKCHVCGENEFNEREGFYYCQECGTKQEQLRHIEVDQEDEYNQEKLNTKKLKILVTKAEKPQLTSWECYNYILRGFVEELLSFGAKEELKLMTLQVWAAYLRRMEVAFFNRKQPDLPKLGVKYLQNDVETIYNHSKQARKKRRCSEDASCTSGGESRSGRDWRRSKRKLDESNYSLTSATSAGTGFTSSTSGNSNRAIKIGFNAKARAIYKRQMPKKHLEKHAADAERSLTCHKQPNAREINRTDYNLMLVNTKQIYCILAIALNLISDEIQLSDLVRFIHEGHIGISNVLQYFPENIANNGKEMLKKINFYKCPENYSDKTLREQISLLCKNIGIGKPKKPDLIKLVNRYITELCLPKDVADYIERLINFLPPQFGARTIGFYPGFEARAMAYIIFALKIFYGLDGYKEHRISRSAQKLNSKIKELNRKNCENQSLLFVWNEWVEYIEMRKIIVSQFNSSFCEQFKQCQSTAQVIGQMTEEICRTEDRQNLLNDSNINLYSKQKLKNFRSLFERFQDNYKLSENDKKPPIIEFKPSFTPALSYMKNIMLLYDNERNAESSIDLNIPDYMRIDHSQRNINSYLQVKPLIKYFGRHQLKLNVHAIATTNNRTYVGIFQAPRTVGRTNLKIRKACFDITEEEWAEYVVAEVAQKTDDLEFKTELNQYKTTLHSDRYKRESKKNAIFTPYMNYDLTLLHDDDTASEGDNENVVKRNSNINVSTLSEKEKDELQSMHSFELFSENNMEPIDNQPFITEPRRNLDNIDLFEGISDEETIQNDDGEDDNDDDENDILSSSQEFPTLSLKSGCTTPPIFEEFIKVEPDSPHPSVERMSQEQKNKATKSKDLKMYISNMDCWIMLGSMLTLAKAQRSQLQDKFPRSFTWLLETCAQTINVDWSSVYEQLLCIEIMFGLSIDNLNTIKNCVYINPTNSIKEIQSILNSYREIW